MSWNEEDPGVWDQEQRKYVGGGKIRAIALCDHNGFFMKAINAVRDGDMGKKDEHGVYERKWYGDYIGNGNVSDIRPASYTEVLFYQKYCSLDAEEAEVKKLYGEKYASVTYGLDRTEVLVKPTLLLYIRCKLNRMIDYVDWKFSQIKKQFKNQKKSNHE